MPSLSFTSTAQIPSAQLSAVQRHLVAFSTASGATLFRLTTVSGTEWLYRWTAPGRYWTQHLYNDGGRLRMTFATGTGLSQAWSEAEFSAGRALRPMLFELAIRYGLSALTWSWP